MDQSKSNHRQRGFTFSHSSWGCGWRSSVSCSCFCFSLFCSGHWMSDPIREPLRHRIWAFIARREPPSQLLSHTPLPLHFPSELEPSSAADIEGSGETDPGPPVQFGGGGGGRWEAGWRVRTERASRAGAASSAAPLSTKTPRKQAVHARMSHLKTRPRK